MSSFQDCLNFIHHRKVNVHRDAVICTVDETDIQTGYCFIKLSQETYQTLLSELHNVEDLLPEGEGCEEASEEESDEERNSNVLVKHSIVKHFRYRYQRLWTKFRQRHVNLPKLRRRKV